MLQLLQSFNHTCSVACIVQGGTETIVNVSACAETPSTSRAAQYHPVLNPMRGKSLLHTIDFEDYLMTLVQITGAILFWRGIWCS